MRIYGLTGGIASGKTTVSDQLQQLGAYCVDTDIVARDVVAVGSPTLQHIRDTFGDAFLHEDGTLNRANVKTRIFNDSRLKTDYEAIIHPAIRQRTLSQINNAPVDAPYTLVVVPLLFETGFDAYTDQNIVVDIPEALQIRRAIARKPADEPLIRQIIAQQIPRSERLRRADFVIKNDQDLVHLRDQVEKLHQHLLAEAL